MQAAAETGKDAAVIGFDHAGARPTGRAVRTTSAIPRATSCVGADEGSRTLVISLDRFAVVVLFETAGRVVREADLVFRRIYGIPMRSQISFHARHEEHQGMPLSQPR
jgi:hypothetical protein